MKYVGAGIDAARGPIALGRGDVVEAGLYGASAAGGVISTRALFPGRPGGLAGDIVTAVAGLGITVYARDKPSRANDRNFSDMMTVAGVDPALVHELSQHVDLDTSNGFPWVGAPGPGSSRRRAAEGEDRLANCADTRQKPVIRDDCVVFHV